MGNTLQDKLSGENIYSYMKNHPVENSEIDQIIRSIRDLQYYMKNPKASLNNGTKIELRYSDKAYFWNDTLVNLANSVGHMLGFPYELVCEKSFSRNPEVITIALDQHKANLHSMRV